MYLLAAHLIIFWLSQDSNLTPPVCLAAFAAAGIAKTPPMRTGLEAWKLGKGLYIMPLLFAFSNLIAGEWIDRFEVFFFAIPGILSFAIFVEGYWNGKLKIYERLIFVATTLLLLFPDKVFGYKSIIPHIQDSHIVGLLVFAIMLLIHNKRVAKTATQVEKV
jgi:TRAP-type uncharacterized transport system fused permease subunit